MPMNKEAFDYCIYLLSQRDYSEYKIKKKLNSRKYSPEDIQLVLAKLKELNYLREEEYQRMRIKALALKGYSDSYIVQKLAQEELYPTLESIAECKTDNNISSKEQIEYLIEKKMRFKEIPEDREERYKFKNKIINFLASKGYRYNEIQAHLPSELN